MISLEIQNVIYGNIYILHILEKKTIFLKFHSHILHILYFISMSH